MSQGPLISDQASKNLQGTPGLSALPAASVCPAWLKAVTLPSEGHQVGNPVLSIPTSYVPQTGINIRYGAGIVLGPEEKE
jgi:hypothetical protein